MELTKCELCGADFDESKTKPITCFDESLLVCYECEGLIRGQREHCEK